MSNDNDQFVLAAIAGAVARMKQLHARGVDVNVADSDGWTALRKTAYWGQLEAARWLVSAGADVNLASAGGFSPLYVACQEGKEEMSRFLLGAGAGVNQANNDDATPLNIGVQHGHDAVVQSLIAAGADLNKANNYGAAPLFNSAQSGHDAVVKLLIAAGADVKRAANCGATPYDAGRGNPVIAKLLLDAGAVGTFSGFLMAAQRGDLDTMKQFEGVDVNQTDGEGATALYLACMESKVEVVQFLFDKGADVEQACDDGSRCLQITARQDLLDVLRRLLIAGADVKAQGYQSCSALFFACYSGARSTVRALLLVCHADMSVRGDAEPPFNQLARDAICADPKVDDTNAAYVHQLFDVAERRETRRASALRTVARSHRRALQHRRTMARQRAVSIFAELYLSR